MGVAQDKIYTAWKHNSLRLHKNFVHIVNFCLLSRFLVKSGISEPQHSANDTLKNDALLHFHFRPVATYHGLPTPNEAFFHEIQNLWAWADKLGR